MLTSKKAEPVRKNDLEPASPPASGEKNAEDWGGANPGDPGPAMPEPRQAVDPSEDPRIPVGEFPRGV
jgi:hypothetical protein